MTTLLLAVVWWFLTVCAAIFAAVIGRVAWTLVRDWREARRPVFVPVEWCEVFDRETAL